MHLNAHRLKFPGFFVDVLDGSKDKMFECFRAQIHAGLVSGEIYVVDIPGAGVVGGALWFGPGEEFLMKFVFQVMNC